MIAVRARRPGTLIGRLQEAGEGPVLLPREGPIGERDAEMVAETLPQAVLLIR